MPTWLDGRTIAIIGTVLTVGICICAVICATTSALKAEMKTRRTEVSASLEEMRTELASTAGLCVAGGAPSFLLGCSFASRRTLDCAASLRDTVR